MAKIASKNLLLTISTILPNDADESTAFPENISQTIEETLQSIIEDIDNKYVVEVVTIEE
jgi:hypothetical protein